MQAEKNIIKERSFDHAGKIYDVVAFVEPAKPLTIAFAVMCNGQNVRYTYPDAFRMTQRQEITHVSAGYCPCKKHECSGLCDG